MPQLKVMELVELAASALEGQGFSTVGARPIAEEFVAAEVAGVRTHGLGKLVSLNLGDLSAVPMVVEQGALLVVDGNGGNGFLTMQSLVPKVEAAARQHGVTLALVRNFSRYSSLYPYTDALARRGLVAVLVNSAGPAAVTPHGSLDPLTGTNPICFSFPLPDGDSQTFDFATSELVWGAIRQASLDGTALPLGPFIDSNGKSTADPTEVNAVRSFGGAKGFALNLAIEVLGGLLTGGAAGNNVKSEFDCGALLLAVDPLQTSASSTFPQLVDDLFAAVRATRPDGSDAVRCPGDRGRSRIDLAQQSAALVEIPEATHLMLERMASGESVADLSSNPLFN